MRRLDAVLGIVVALAASSVSITVHGQTPQTSTEDLTPCGTARAEPAQSGTWAVLFCNRTGHDIVVQFHDNDCPADNWSRRGNVYEKQIARGESVAVPLCYARETQPAATPPPGVPQLRLPGGKGVMTTWSIVGDCGDRSDRTHMDARTFYDRGAYETGIILLQHPAAASHCFSIPAVAAGQTSGSAAPAANTAATAASRAAADAPPATSALTTAPAPPAASASTTVPGLPAASASTTASGPPAATNTEAAANSNTQSLASGGPPALAATIDTTNRFSRVVHVLATSSPDAPTYHCRFRLALDFSDGSSWIDRQQADVHAGDANAPVITRKYGKTVTKVVVTSPSCVPSG